MRKREMGTVLSVYLPVEVIRDVERVVAERPDFAKNRSTLVSMALSKFLYAGTPEVRRKSEEIEEVLRICVENNNAMLTDHFNNQIRLLLAQIKQASWGEIRIERADGL